MLPTSTVSWSKLFHLFTTLCEKKYLLISLTLCFFFNLNVCPLVPLPCAIRLTELKAESRRRREQREVDAAMSVAETRRRREIVEKQFYEWNDGKKVDLTLIHTALRTYADIYSGTLLFSRPLDPVDLQDHGGFYLADYMTVYLPVAAGGDSFPFHKSTSGTLCGQFLFISLIPWTVSDSTLCLSLWLPVLFHH